MASSRLFSLNLGMQTASAAEFRATAGGGLSLCGWKKVDLIVDPAADATRTVQVESACKELRTGLRAPSKATVAVVLPSQAVFARFVRLPGATVEDISQIIGFEAQQNVPFPIDEVVWDYKVVGDSREGSWDVVLVAIKGDQLSEVTNAVATSGFAPDCISAATTALFNAFRYNYPDATGVSVLVDIGARTTNVIFIEGNRFFSRTIPVGGITLSGAIAREFQQDVTLAERLKIEKGFVSLGGAYAEPDDPTVAKISKVLRNTMTRLHSEILRSVTSYRQNQGGEAPARILLTGGGSHLPYVAEFFKEKFQLPVEFFNPLQRVSVASEALGQEVMPYAHLMGELVGAALQQQGSATLNINLRPPELVKEQDLAQRKPFLVIAVACILLALGAWYGYFLYAKTQVETKLAEVEADIQGGAGIEALAKQIDEIIASQKASVAGAAPMIALCRDRSAWPSILDELGNSLPKRFIWITSVTPLSDPSLAGGGRAGRQGGGSPQGNQGGDAQAAPGGEAGRRAEFTAINAIEIKGLYLPNPPNVRQQAIIDEFVENLKLSPIFRFKGADGNELDMSSIVTQRTTPDGQHWAYGYTIMLPLVNPISQ